MFLAYIFHIYAHIICFISSFLNKKKHIFFQILNVSCISNKGNLTENFVTNKFDLTHDEVYSFEWMFDNVKFIQYLNKNTLQYLVPYSFYNMRCQPPDNKIIGTIVTHNETKEIENITPFMKQIAGPKQNFY